MMVGGLVVATGSVTAGATTPTCAASNFTGTATVSTLPGGTTVHLVLESHYFPTCEWSHASTWRFASATGTSVGAAVAGPPTVTAVDDTFTIAETLTTMEGVQCTSDAASAIRVTSPNGSNVLVSLPTTVGVCVNGTTKWTTLGTPAFPSPPACKSSSLRVTVGAANGAAGTIYHSLVFTNVGTTACAVSGIPSVQPTTGALAGVAHILVGPPSRHENLSASGYGDPVRLTPQTSASANYGVAETGNWSVVTCGPKAVQSLSVSLAGGNFFVPLAASVCTKLASTVVSGLVPGTTGLTPIPS